MKEITCQVLVVPSTVNNWAKSVMSPNRAITHDSIVKGAARVIRSLDPFSLVCLEDLSFNSTNCAETFLDGERICQPVTIGNTYGPIAYSVQKFPIQVRMDLAAVLSKAKASRSSVSFIHLVNDENTGLLDEGRCGVILGSVDKLNHELAHIMPAILAAKGVGQNMLQFSRKCCVHGIGQGVIFENGATQSIDDLDLCFSSLDGSTTSSRLWDQQRYDTIKEEMANIESGVAKNCAGVLFHARHLNEEIYVFGSHDSVKTQCSVIPVIGYPGNGYESVLRSLANFGYATECRDELGYRVYSELNNHWSYKPDFVLAKARQYSETRPWTIFWSIGGDNVLDLLSMAWPVVVVIDPVPSSVWKARVNEWRAKNAPQLGELDEAEIKRYESEISRWKMVIERSASNVVRISGNLTPDGIAAAIISNLRPIVPLILAPKFEDSNVIIAGPTVGKSYAAQVAGYFDIQNSKYACESAFNLWDRPYEVAHAAHMVAQRRRRLQGIFVPLLCAPFFPNAPVYYRDAEDLTVAAIRRGDTSDQIKRELAYQAADLGMIRDHHKGRLIQLRANEFISDVLLREQEKTALTKHASVEWLADSMATSIMPFLQRYEGAWRNPKNGSTRVVFSRGLDHFVVLKTVSTKVMTVKFWKGSLDVTKSFWNTTQAFDPGLEGMAELFLNLQICFSISDDATKALITAAQHAVTEAQLSSKSESDLEKKEV